MFHPVSRNVGPTTSTRGTTSAGSSPCSLNDCSAWTPAANVSAVSAAVLLLLMVFE
jgi:hypothetical protein